MDSVKRSTDQWKITCINYKQNVIITKRALRHPILIGMFDQLGKEISAIQEMEIEMVDMNQLMAGVYAIDIMITQIKRCDTWLSLVVNNGKQELSTDIERLTEEISNLVQTRDSLRVENILNFFDRLYSARKGKAEQAIQAEKAIITNKISALSTFISDARDRLKDLEEEEQDVLARLQWNGTEGLCERLPQIVSAMKGRGLFVGDEWSCPITGMKFIWIPGGTFLMGDQFGDGDEEEQPVHPVKLAGFWLGKYPVTQQEWQAVMGENPAHFQNGDRYPVENISWHDAQLFVTQLNKLGDRQYRLPTESEWEYAARSGGKRERYAGGEHLNSLAWYSNINGSTQPVGQKAANGLGLYDMSGNVFEWVQDGKKEYVSELRSNPVEGGDAPERVNRGGSWFTSARYVRCTFRNGNTPEFRSYAIGVRLARCATRVMRGEE
ncbi:MAG: SUMF1/EgtB/PvdO family nonheme iron enzyme [Magnetococcus sp. YQC-5]